MTDKKEAPVKRTYTKADYEKTARGLANSVIIYSRTSSRIESRISEAELWARQFNGASDWLEVELLKAAWEREKADRAGGGKCIDCGYGPGYHDRGCPEYQRLEL